MTRTIPVPNLLTPATAIVCGLRGCTDPNAELAQVAVLTQQLSRQSVGGMPFTPFTPAHHSFASRMHSPSAPRGASADHDNAIPPLGDLEGLAWRGDLEEEAPGDELAWMSMLVESSAAALNESRLEEEEGGGGDEQEGAGDVLHLEVSFLGDANVLLSDAKSSLGDAKSSLSDELAG
jgi:hypothetical protein